MSLRAFAVGAVALLVGLAGAGPSAAQDYPDTETPVLTVTVDGTRVCASYDGTGTLTISLDDFPELSQSGPAPEFCADFSEVSVCGHGTREIHGNVRFAGTAPQSEQVTIDVPFTLLIPGDGSPCDEGAPGASSGTTSAGWLPSTGAEIASWLALLAAVLLAAGAGVLAWTRRHD